MAHTLTFNYDYPSSGYTVRKGSISGEYVHSPYTLQNGDELYFQTVKINNTINGTSYSWSDLENTTLEFTDVDINIVGASGPQIAIDGVPFVLKYTESTPQPTLTFKHFYDAGTIGSGTVKFRHYSQQEPTPPTPVYTDCLTFTGETSEFTLKATNKDWDGTLQWSTDHNTWTTLVGKEAMQSVGKKLYLRGKGNTTLRSGDGIQFSLSARAACSGNIQTLLDYENPPTNVTTSYCFSRLFYNCKLLTTPPTLPATTLSELCYATMFSGCTSLTTVPDLPATTLAYHCYSSMFYGCTSITTAPLLPATTLPIQCYANMFNGCTKLKLSTTQTAEYKTPWRIPSSGTISTTEPSWNVDMFTNTGGTFTGNPSINTTYYGAW